MTSGINVPDGGSYGCLTDGSGNLITATTLVTNIPKPSSGRYSKDGSRYMTLTDGGSTGGGAYVAKAVRFDTNANLFLDVSSFSPSNLLTIVTWVRVATSDLVGDPAPDWVIAASPPVKVGNYLNDPTDLYASAFCGAFGEFTLCSNPGVFTGDLWHLSCSSWDIRHAPGSNFGFLYFDGASKVNPALTVDTFNGIANIIYYNANDRPSPSLGGNPLIGGAGCPIELSDCRVWFDQCIDFSVPGNMAKFLAGGKPVDPSLAVDAFGAPAISFTGNASDWLAQAAVAGFTLYDGALTNASTSPSD